MTGPVELPLERPFQASLVGATSPEKLAAETRGESEIVKWLLPAIDLVSSSAALALVVFVSASRFSIGLMLAPLMLVVVNGALGVYGHTSSRRARRATEGRSREFFIRLLVAVCFAWTASLLAPLGTGEQLALWVSFILLDSLGRSVGAALLRRASPNERWILVGDEAAAERLSAYEPLRNHVSVVCTVAPPADEESDGAMHRVGALDVVDRYCADRVVIASQPATDERLLELVRAFKAIGVPVSMLPRPLNLVEAPAATLSRVGGVPLIDVEALAAYDAVPYSGPNRRRGDRQSKVSVVVPAMNEEGNIGSVLRQLPAGLHEVILVDGNSRDNTVAEAKQAYPEVHVVTQTGRGKGNALRSGFAAVTGNLIVMLDADGSADPAEIPRFVAALEAGADFAKGSRFIEGGGSSDITTLRRVGNSFLSLTVNMFHGTSFTDLCYGYNAFWTRCLPYISLDVPGFEVETLINLRIAGAGMKITEVASHEADRISGQSNLNTFRDGFRVLRTIIRETHRRHSVARRWRPPARHQEARKAEMALP